MFFLKTAAFIDAEKREEFHSPPPADTIGLEIERPTMNNNKGDYECAPPQSPQPPQPPPWHHQQFGRRLLKFTQELLFPHVLHGAGVYE